MADDRPRTVTMVDVANHAGVSRALVSIVLRGVPGASPQNREKVLTAAAALDYHPDQRARMLGSARSRTLGVVYGLHRPFHGELVEELYTAVADGGWRLAVEPTAPTRSEATAVRALLDLRCEAVLLLGPTTSTAALGELAQRVPVVCVARSVRRAGVDVVRTDDALGARLAVEHLLALGHHRIAHVHGGRAPGAAERRAGYRAAVRAAGLEPELLTGGPTEVDGQHAAAEVLRPGGPTAVVAFNDACAAGLLATARRAGTNVPEELSLVGFDDTAVAALATVSLTTVAQDSRALARRAVERAVRRVEDGTAPEAETVISPHLVQRSTTAAPAD